MAYRNAGLCVGGGGRGMKKCTVCGMVFEEEYEGQMCPKCGYEGWFEIIEDKEIGGPDQA